ncbi:Uncharacterised protein [Vibrio cholerae]|nr:Uncharacterised protein [Vibrio cholerae]
MLRANIQFLSNLVADSFCEKSVLFAQPYFVENPV